MIDRIVSIKSDNISAYAMSDELEFKFEVDDLVRRFTRVVQCYSADLLHGVVKTAGFRGRVYVNLNTPYVSKLNGAYVPCLHLFAKNNGEMLLFQDHSILTSIEWPKFQSGPVKLLQTPILSVSMTFLKKGCLPPTIESYQ